ncbi:LysR substrate-binding domain-containing protein [Paraburkholderia sp. RL18-103-BIB-C]|uniref:LysR family transcriptional regulator n=1 Tax=unclassified Paraburkholderia TaxID=2615204 RepID=UPI0038BD5859
MDLRQLRYFVAIVDAGSMARAAERIFVAQTSLSEHIKALERTLGTTLLERHPRGVRPTRAGRVLYEHANAILKMQQVIVEEVKSCGDEVQGTVSVGMPNTVSEILAAPLLEAVLTHLPGVRLCLVQGFSGTLERSLLDGKLDISLLFITAPQAAERLAVTHLLDEAMFVVMSNARASRREAVRVAELEHEPLFCPHAEHGLTKVIMAYARHHGATLRIGAEVDSLPAMIGAATRELGYAVLPGGVFHASELPPDVALLPFDPPLDRPLSLCKPRLRPAGSAVLAVEATLLDVVGELVASGQWKGARPAPL